MSKVPTSVREPEVDDRDAYVTVDARAVILDLSDDTTVPHSRRGSGPSRAAQVAVQRWQEQTGRSSQGDADRSEQLPAPSPGVRTGTANQALVSMDPTSRWRWLSATVRDAYAKRVR